MKSCRIRPSPTENWEKSFVCVLSCSDIPPPSFYFLLTSVAFSQRKDSLQGHFFFFSVVRNKILLALKLASHVCQQKSSLQQVG